MSPPGATLGRLSWGMSPTLAWAGLAVFGASGEFLWVSGRFKWQMEKSVCVQLSQDKMKTNWKKMLSELRVSRVLYLWDETE